VAERDDAGRIHRCEDRCEHVGVGSRQGDADQDERRDADAERERNFGAPRATGRARFDDMAVARLAHHWGLCHEVGNLDAPCDCPAHA
jgi:hypothetical protein